MKRISLGLLWVFIAVPLYSQGLTLVMKEAAPTGGSTPMLQTDRTHARLDIPSLLSQVLYDSTTKTLQVLVPLLKTYNEYTPASIQQRPPAAGGQPAPAAVAPITYKKTGSSKVLNWTCTTYEGFRGSEKVTEVCAAEGASIGLTAADFTIVQQAIDLAKRVAPADMIERIPTYGTVASQGFAGFPVRRVTYLSGQPISTTELVEIRREPVPAANFTLPAGFVRMPQDAR